MATNCKHARWECIDRNTGDCRGCGAPAIKVIDALLKEIEELKNERGKLQWTNGTPLRR
jgi:hypothetical protein